uniref:SH2 domain-containing protein n=1 Tax=Anas platyrhynchos platyrhynchos TaxID=8840 RepID=A0A493TMK5_ANAPP
MAPKGARGVGGVPVARGGPRCKEGTRWHGWVPVPWMCPHGTGGSPWQGHLSCAPWGQWVLRALWGGCVPPPWLSPWCRGTDRSPRHGPAPCADGSQDRGMQTGPGVTGAVFWGAVFWGVLCFGVTAAPCRWYHGPIGRAGAETLLALCREGSFLVRDCETSPEDYSLSLRSSHGFVHVKLTRTRERHFVLGRAGAAFPSVPEAVRHYTARALPIRGARHLSLLYPVAAQPP